jgi:hypothetical protein
MPILDITEYQELAATGRGHLVMSGQEPALLNQQVVVGGTSSQSAAFSDTTRFVRIHADVSCRVAIGTNPTASASSMRIVAGGTEYLGVRPGLKLAVISTT